MSGNEWNAFIRDSVHASTVATLKKGLWNYINFCLLLLR